MFRRSVQVFTADAAQVGNIMIASFVEVAGRAPGHISFATLSQTEHVSRLSWEEVKPQITKYFDILEDTKNK